MLVILLTEVMKTGVHHSLKRSSVPITEKHATRAIVLKTRVCTHRVIPSEVQQILQGDEASASVMPTQHTKGSSITTVYFSTLTKPQY
jgi:hypothetical protein